MRFSLFQRYCKNEKCTNDEIFLRFVLHIKKIVIPLHPLSETHSEYAVKQMRNFRASEWESLLSHNERSRKCRVYEINAEIAQLVEHNLAAKI